MANSGTEIVNNATPDTTGEKVTQDYTGGSKHILTTGVTSQSKNRLRTAIAETYSATTNSCTWLAADNIKEITVFITATNSISAVPSENYALLAFNAGSDAIASAWLTEVDSAADDAQLEKIPIGVMVTLRFTSALTRLDALPVDINSSLGETILASGQATTNTVNTLTDSTAAFIDDGILAGDIAKNLTDATEEAILTLTSDTALTFTGDPFPDGNEAYEIVRRTNIHLFVGAH